MKKEKKRNSFNRRDFIKIITTAAFSGPAVLTSACSETRGSSETKEVIHLNEQPTMAYRKLGRTGFMSSRLVFGCGAALKHGRAVRLLERAFDAGINHFDVEFFKHLTNHIDSQRHAFTQTFGAGFFYRQT